MSHHLPRARESMGPGSHIKVVSPRASLTNHVRTYLLCISVRYPTYWARLGCQYQPNRQGVTKCVGREGKTLIKLDILRAVI